MYQDFFLAIVIGAFIIVAVIRLLIQCLIWLFRIRLRLSKPSQYRLEESLRKLCRAHQEYQNAYDAFTREHGVEPPQKFQYNPNSSAPPPPTPSPLTDVPSSPSMGTRSVPPPPIPETIPASAFEIVPDSVPVPAATPIPTPVSVPKKHPCIVPSPTPSAVSVSPSAPRRDWGKIFSGFLEERNIRWGELLGGMLVVGCSVALMISLRNDLRRIPHVEFLMLSGLIIAFYGVGIYAFRRWKLRHTSHGFLDIAAMLVPLAFTGIVNRRGAESDLHVDFLFLEAGMFLVFVFLQSFASRYSAPRSSRTLTLTLTTLWGFLILHCVVADGISGMYNGLSEVWLPSIIPFWSMVPGGVFGAGFLCTLRRLAPTSASPAVNGIHRFFPLAHYTESDAVAMLRSTTLTFFAAIVGVAVTLADRYGLTLAGLLHQEPQAWITLLLPVYIAGTQLLDTRRPRIQKLYHDGDGSTGDSGTPPPTIPVVFHVIGTSLVGATLVLLTMVIFGTLASQWLTAGLGIAVAGFGIAAGMRYRQRSPHILTIGMLAIGFCTGYMAIREVLWGWLLFTDAWTGGMLTLLVAIYLGIAILFEYFGSGAFRRHAAIFYLVAAMVAGVASLLIVTLAGNPLLAAFVYTFHAGLFLALALKLKRPAIARGGWLLLAIVPMWGLVHGGSGYFWFHLAAMLSGTALAGRVLEIVADRVFSGMWTFIYRKPLRWVVGALLWGSMAAFAINVVGRFPGQWLGAEWIGSLRMAILWTACGILLSHHFFRMLGTMAALATILYGMHPWLEWVSGTTVPQPIWNFIHWPQSPVFAYQALGVATLLLILALVRPAVRWWIVKTNSPGWRRVLFGFDRTLRPATSGNGDMKIQPGGPSGDEPSEPTMESVVEPFRQAGLFFRNSAIFGTFDQWFTILWIGICTMVVGNHMWAAFGGGTLNTSGTVRLASVSFTPGSLGGRIGETSAIGAWCVTVALLGAVMILRSGSAKQIPSGFRPDRWKSMWRMVSESAGVSVTALGVWVLVACLDAGIEWFHGNLSALRWVMYVLSVAMFIIGMILTGLGTPKVFSLPSATPDAAVEPKRYGWVKRVTAVDTMLVEMLLLPGLAASWLMAFPTERVSFVGTLVLGLIPALAAAAACTWRAVRQRSDGWCFFAGLIAVFAGCLAVQHGVRHTGESSVHFVVHLLQMVSIVAGAWAIAWLFTTRPGVKTTSDATVAEMAKKTRPWMRLQLLLALTPEVGLLAVFTLHHLFCIPQMFPRWFPSMSAIGAPGFAILAYGLVVTALALHAFRFRRFSVRGVGFGLIGAVISATAIAAHVTFDPATRTIGGATTTFFVGMGLTAVALAALAWTPRGVFDRWFVQPASTGNFLKSMNVRFMFSPRAPTDPAMRAERGAFLIAGVMTLHTLLYGWTILQHDVFHSDIAMAGMEICFALMALMAALRRRSCRIHAWTVVFLQLAFLFLVPPGAKWWSEHSLSFPAAHWIVLNAGLAIGLIHSIYMQRKWKSEPRISDHDPPQTGHARGVILSVCIGLIPWVVALPTVIPGEWLLWRLPVFSLSMQFGFLTTAALLTLAIWLRGAWWIGRGFWLLGFGWFGFHAARITLWSNEHFLWMFIPVWMTLAAAAVRGSGVLRRRIPILRIPILHRRDRRWYAWLHHVLGILCTILGLFVVFSHAGAMTPLSHMSPLAFSPTLMWATLGKLMPLLLGLIGVTAWLDSASFLGARRRTAQQTAFVLSVLTSAACFWGTLPSSGVMDGKLFRWILNSLAIGVASLIVAAGVWKILLHVFDRESPRRRIPTWTAKISNTIFQSRYVVGAAVCAAWVIEGVHYFTWTRTLEPVMIDLLRSDVIRSQLWEIALFGVLIFAGGVRLIRMAVAPKREMPMAIRERFVYAAEAVFAVGFLHVYWTMPFLFRHGLFERYGLFLILGIALTGTVLAEFFRRRQFNVLSRPLAQTAFLMPLISALGWWWLPTASVVVWFCIAFFYIAIAVTQRRRDAWLLAILAMNVGFWITLHRHDLRFLDSVQVWLIPPAVAVLIAQWFERWRLTVAQNEAIRWCALAVIYGSSSADMFIVGLANGFVRPLVLMLISVAAILAGMFTRVRSISYLGIAFLLIDIGAIIKYAAIDRHQTWILWASGIALGSAVLALFAISEKRHARLCDDAVAPPLLPPPPPNDESSG